MVDMSIFNILRENFVIIIVKGIIDIDINIRFILDIKLIIFSVMTVS